MHLTSDVLVGIFTGTITNWNDKAIAQLNPQANLPNLPIVTVHRADGSGTTYIFTDYLSHVSAAWKSQIGTGKSVSWPAAASLGAKGNEGVAGQVRNNPGAIGYVELAYALENGMTYAAIRNKTGAFISPTLESVRAAAGQKATVNPSDFSIVDQAGAASYPICGYSWVMLWKNQPDATKGKALVDLFNWLVTSGTVLRREGPLRSTALKRAELGSQGACGHPIVSSAKPAHEAGTRTPVIKRRRGTRRQT